MKKQMQMYIYKPLISDSIVVSSSICSHDILFTGNHTSCFISFF